MEVVGIHKHIEKVKKGMAEDEAYRYKKKGVMKMVASIDLYRYKEQEVMMEVEVGIYRLMMRVKVVIKNMVTCIHNKVAGKGLMEMMNYIHKEVVEKEMVEVVSNRHIEVEEMMKIVGICRRIKREVKEKVEEEIYKFMKNMLHLDKPKFNEPRKTLKVQKPKIPGNVPELDRS
ncbi:hypothetical protein NC653_022267 [Populus alba x Populus x berolinensis]|uniref:Uncharacterized protein n=1 Tax=Populus alba x Populus x berolinensis TaxID=444605 RepID=A0AAD6Q9A8_9ROSI|nr:hypothetical protein NC653_022267 [Populus alba x Populus x berolinensis]